MQFITILEFTLVEINYILVPIFELKDEKIHGFGKKATKFDVAGVEESAVNYLKFLVGFD